MQNIFNVVVDVDTDRIAGAIEKNAEATITKQIHDEMLEAINKRYVGYNRLDSNEGIIKLANMIMTEIMSKELRDDIIKAASDKLVESIRRTNTWKEAAKKALESGGDNS